jgi:hypothetical protein
MKRKNKKCKLILINESELDSVRAETSEYNSVWMTRDILKKYKVDYQWEYSRDFLHTLFSIKVSIALK